MYFIKPTKINGRRSQSHLNYFVSNQFTGYKYGFENNYNKSNEG